MKSNISSTEKLLDVIRDKKNLSIEDDNPSLHLKKDKNLSFFDSFFLRKKANVGIVIGYNDIKLVKIAQSSSKKRQILDYINIPFEKGLTFESPQFPRFLKQTVSDFIGNLKNISIWSVISSAQAEIRHLKIPKVSKKEIANASFWTYKKEVVFKENEVVFDFDILGEVVDNGITKYEIAAYTVPKQEVVEFKELFSKIGYPLYGLTIIPFAIQNFMRLKWIDNEASNLCNIYIGRGWTRIDIFTGHNIVLSRGVRAGINSMIETIREKMSNRMSAIALASQFEDNESGEEITPENIKAESQITLEQASKIFYSLLDDSVPLRQGDFGYGLKDEQIYEMIIPALDRLVGQVERTLKHYSLKFKDEAVAKIHISGPISTYKPIINYFGDQLLVKSESFRDAVEPFAAAELSSLGEAVGRIESYRLKLEKMGDKLSLETFDKAIKPLSSELPFLGESKKVASVKESFAPAVGVALSEDSITPNFLFTQKDKEKVTNVKLINKIISICFIVLLSALIAFNFSQGRLISDKKSEFEKLNKQLDQYNPRIDQNLISQLVAQTQSKKKILAEFGKKYQGMAAICEISEITPQNIKLKNIVLELGDMIGVENENKDSANNEKKTKNPKSIFIEGIIKGERLTLESSFTGYIVKLKSSPLFGDVIEKENKIQRDEKDSTKEVLYFSAKLELL